MKKQKDSTITWVFILAFAIGSISGWFLNNLEYNLRPYKIEVKKQSFIKAQQVCGANNVSTRLKVDEFDRFDCADWEEATKSGIQK